jgi:hypothetical protein
METYRQMLQLQRRILRRVAKCEVVSCGTAGCVFSWPCVTGSDVVRQLVTPQAATNSTIQRSSTVQDYLSIRPAVFCDITQRQVVTLHRRFGTTYRSLLQGSRWSHQNRGGSLISRLPFNAGNLWRRSNRQLVEKRSKLMDSISKVQMFLCRL